MRVEELTVEVRDRNLNRVGQILPADLVGFKAVLRFNNVGTWEIELPVGHKVGELLRLPGYGLIVTGPNGVMLSGPTTSAENTKERGNPEGTWIITGSDDSIILGERLAYPTPSTADVTLQTQAYDSVYNTKTSTAMYGYVKRNLVSGTAPTARVVPGLTTATDTLLGTTVTKSARFNVLGELLTELAVVDGLGFDIKQQGTSLVFSVYQPVDRSLSIRMDVANNTLSKTSYGYAAPGVTRAIVAGQGQAEDRTFVEVTTSGSTSAQALWARRIENFIDQRNTNVTAELTQAGLERLAEAGNTITSVDVVPSSDTTMRPFVDWNLGDRVGVVIGGQEVAAVVTQIAITIESDGVRIGATVGEPTGVDYESLMTSRQQSTSRAINALERKESASGGGGGSSVTIADTAPASPVDNSVWVRSTDFAALVRYNDGNSSQWVEIKKAEDTALGARVTSLEGVRPVSIGGTGTSSFTSGTYLKGNGTSAISTQSGIPATDITSGALDVARGGTGVTNGTGSVAMIPTSTSIFNGTGTATIAANGKVTFTNANSFSLNGVFTSAYDYYTVYLYTYNGPGNYLYAKFASGGTYTTAAAYYTTALYKQGAGTGNWADVSGQGFISVGYLPGSETAGTEIMVINPLNTLAGAPIMDYNSFYMGGAGTWVKGVGKWNGGGTFDGINFLSSAGNLFSGTVQVWGHRR